MTLQYCFNKFNRPRMQSLKRHGIYLLDACVGLVLISTAMFILLQSLFQLIDHRTDQKLQQIAVDTLLNVQDMIDLKTLSDNDREKLEPLETMIARSLPDGQLSVEKLQKPAVNNITFFRIIISYENGKNRPRCELSIVRAIDSTPKDTPPVEDDVLAEN